MHFTYIALHKQCLNSSTAFLLPPPQKTEYHSVCTMSPLCLQHFLETILYSSLKSCFTYCTSFNYFTFHHAHKQVQSVAQRCLAFYMETSTLLNRGVSMTSQMKVQTWKSSTTTCEFYCISIVWMMSTE
jgi:hypothetical protein